MGIFSSIAGIFSSITWGSSNLTDALETQEESLESMRKKHGFKNFSAEMERMQNYDPMQENENKNLAPSVISNWLTSTPQPGKKK